MNDLNIFCLLAVLPDEEITFHFYAGDLQLNRIDLSGLGDDV